MSSESCYHHGLWHLEHHTLNPGLLDPLPLSDYAEAEGGLLFAGGGGGGAAMLSSSSGGGGAVGPVGGSLFGDGSGFAGGGFNHNPMNIALRPHELLAQQHLRAMMAEQQQQYGGSGALGGGVGGYGRVGGADGANGFGQLLPSGKWLESGVPLTLPREWDLPEQLPILPPPPPPPSVGGSGASNGAQRKLTTAAAASIMRTPQQYRTPPASTMAGRGGQ